ncbi:hypothetical protein CK218_27805 [Mesorhizobium sp. WSM3879]|uniref:hypothetical protein n=1 Tax=Mesorhizobium sp. WSM3879 TaxID=2029406 RepID=UPI000BB04D94|nr:hypothetical protein [Mesorhizobium sp. WSM3879]PBB77911.1 hypothetical protein CK218_27805 [Mesorhizobium sp. WSM3879]
MASFWKSPIEIYQAVMADAAVLTDVDAASGIPASQAVYGYREQMRAEEAIWKLAAQMTSVSAEDRALYEERAAALQERVGKVQAAVLRLMSSQAAEGRWFAVGHRNAESGEEIIPGRYWPFLTLDMIKATAKGEVGEFCALRCAFLADVPAGHPILERVRLANLVTSTTASIEAPAAHADKSTWVESSTRKRGPKPVQLERVKAAMRAFDQTALAVMTEEEMVARFDASRDTCRRARRELSEFPRK